MKRSSKLLSMIVSLCVSSSIAAAATSITGCTTITKPGSYVLTGNFTATTSELKPTWVSGETGCIIIAADFVTLDLGGHLITGPGASGAWSIAISQDTTSRSGDVVQNGSVTAFLNGIAFAGSGHTVQNINATGNLDAGIYILNGGNRIMNNTTNNNTKWGIYITACPNVVVGNMAAGNGTGSTGANIIEPTGCTDNRQQNVPKP
jgi:parallel beta-helix repeat protein